MPCRLNALDNSRESTNGVNILPLLAKARQQFTIFCGDSLLASTTHLLIIVAEMEKHIA